MRLSVERVAMSMPRCTVEVKDVEPEDTILKLKERVYEAFKQNHQPSTQRLILLPDDQQQRTQHVTLAPHPEDEVYLVRDFGVRDGDRLMLILLHNNEQFNIERQVRCERALRAYIQRLLQPVVPMGAGAPHIVFVSTHSWTDEDRAQQLPDQVLTFVTQHPNVCLTMLLVDPLFYTNNGVPGAIGADQVDLVVDDNDNNNNNNNDGGHDDSGLRVWHLKGYDQRVRIVTAAMLVSYDSTHVFWVPPNEHAQRMAIDCGTAIDEDAKEPDLMFPHSGLKALGAHLAVNKGMLVYGDCVRAARVFDRVHRDGHSLLTEEGTTRGGDHRLWQPLSENTWFSIDGQTGSVVAAIGGGADDEQKEKN